MTPHKTRPEIHRSRENSPRSPVVIVPHSPSYFRKTTLCNSACFAIYALNRHYSSGSSFTIDAPWLLPTQNGGGVVRLSTTPLLTLVGLGRRYSTNCPVRGSSRRMRSVNSPPLHTFPSLSLVAS